MSAVLQSFFHIRSLRKVRSVSALQSNFAKARVRRRSTPFPRSTRMDGKRTPAQELSCSSGFSTASRSRRILSARTVSPSLSSSADLGSAGLEELQACFARLGLASPVYDAIPGSSIAPGPSPDQADLQDFLVGLDEDNVSPTVPLATSWTDEFSLQWTSLRSMVESQVVSYVETLGHEMLWVSPVQLDTRKPFPPDSDGKELMPPRRRL